MKNSTKSLLFSGLILLIVTAYSFSTGLTTSVLKGTVRSKTDKEIIPGAVIELRQKIGEPVKRVMTDLDGHFEFKGINPGTYNLKINVIGYQTKEITNIQLEAGKTKTLIIELEETLTDLKEVLLHAPQKQDYKKSEAEESISLNQFFDQGVRSRAPNSLNAVSETFNTEQYDHMPENDFHATTDSPLSTFSIDVDPASYANVRRFINSGNLPPVDAVRIEEMINYFSYDYPEPKTNEPFSIITEHSTCPWNKDHQLVSIALQAKKIPMSQLPPSNLVFLLDVSGSMNSEDKLPLLKKSIGLLTNQLRSTDKVAIVVYAGNAGLVLPATSGNDKATILQALDQLSAGGSTAGGAGIQLAYKIALENFIPNGNNRVILATEGDFNVGVSSDGELVRIIEEKRATGIFLTVLGFGTGNLKDSRMEKLADKGNGNYAYIDNIMEANKVLVKEAGGTLFTLAKDVKLQIEFNPQYVKAYKLIGYENRILQHRDFNDDKKDAGDLGSGHTVTALYEIVPAGSDAEFSKVDPLKYQPTQKLNTSNDEMLTVKFRYKDPQSETSKLITRVLAAKKVTSLDNASMNLRFAAAVAGFGLILRDSEHKGNADFKMVTSLARSAKGTDHSGDRAAFIQMVETAALLKENLSGK
ncbi:MAG: von Willebrand factor type A domain-containing protein [Bacteroidetes bacterium]|nr:von Willebrand factor type A domain-containing protein [Bacteroidota bacterium]